MVFEMLDICRCVGACVRAFRSVYVLWIEVDLEFGAIILKPVQISY